MPVTTGSLAAGGSVFLSTWYLVAPSEADQETLTWVSLERWTACALLTCAGGSWTSAVSAVVKVTTLLQFDDGPLSNLALTRNL